MKVNKLVYFLNNIKKLMKKVRLENTSVDCGSKINESKYVVD